jgi:uncharacterized membrane protein
MQNMNGKTALGLDANIGALVCYLANFIPCCLPLGLIYSVVVVIQDKTNKLARFHAFQSILLSAIGVVVGCVIYAFVIVGAVAKSGILLSLISLIASLFGMAVLAAIIFCAIKAFQGQIFKLPILGDLADKWSN